MKTVIGNCIYCNAPLYYEEQGDYEQTFWGGRPPKWVFYDGKIELKRG